MARDVKRCLGMYPLVELKEICLLKQLPLSYLNAYDYCSFPLERKVNLGARKAHCVYECG